MNNWIVYKHTSPSGKVYVGITKQKPNKRWQYGHGYKQSKYFFNAILKYGWKNIEHIILEHDLSMEEASKLEKKLIASYKQQGLSYNIAEGGFDGNIRKLTAEEKQNISIKLKEYYKTHTSPTLGKKMPKEVVEKMKINNKKLWQENYNKMYNAVVRNIRVGVYNILTQVYTEFNSEKEAAAFLNIKQTTFRRHINDGSRYNNYIFFPIESCTLEDALSKAYNIEKMNIHCGGQEIKVVQLNLNGDYLATYPSAKHAEMLTGIKANGIGKVCRGESKSSCGYFWLFESVYSKHKNDGTLANLLDDMKNTLHKSREICISPIVQMTLDGSPIHVYKNGQDVYRKTGFDGSAVNKCCKGKLIKAYGYKWQHITKEEYNSYKKQLTA